MHSVGSINIPLLLGIIIALGAIFLVDPNISIHALDEEELMLYDYVDLAQFADTIKDGDKEIEEISMKLMQSSNSFGTTAPDTDTTAPDTDTTAPDTDTTAPDTDTTAPDTDTTAPDTDTTAPDTDTTAPDTDTTAPDTDTTAPDTDTTAPDDDTTAPDDDTTAPDDDTTAPDDDTTAPDDDTTAPDDDTTAPDDDTTAPDDDTTAPDDDTTAPDDDTTAPDDDTTAPDDDTTAPDDDTTAPDDDTTAPDDEENILINQLVRTGKFTEDEATELVTKVKNGTNGASTAEGTLDSDSISTSQSETSTNDATSSDNQINDDESSSNTNNPEEYDDLNGLVDDIKNGDIDTDEISLNAFQDSGAYQGTDKETQDCIDLAGKIGQNLGDSEIVHCSDDANYFRDKYQVSVPQDKLPQPKPEPEPTIPETNATQQGPESKPIPEPEPTIPETNATQQGPEPIPGPNVAEEYDQMEDLVDDIKNGDLDDDEILLDDFIDSGAYQDANKNIQDCIRLAGKIGQNLGDSEIVHCFDDANYFRDKYS